MDEDEEDWSVCLASDGRVDGSQHACLAHATVWERFVRLPPGRNRLKVFNEECLLSAWPLARSSFWLPADATPEGPLEALAQQIFRFHTAGAQPSIDIHKSGCEWWTNVTRSELLRSANAGDIKMHFDKDEHAYAAYGLVVHPVLSTVTYLSDAGAPTVLLPNVVLGGSVAGSAAYVRTGEKGSPGPSSEPDVLLVPPRAGRHLCFDGRWLHGAPVACVPMVAGGVGDSYERVTFCANIWINHKPGNTVRFAERPTLPLATNPLAVAPRLRLLESRGSAARREARTAEVLRTTLQCTAPSDTPSIPDERTKLRLEQTDTPHELLLPSPSQLHGLLGSGRVVRLKGDGIVIRPE
jgi:hypothetical protein